VIDMTNPTMSRGEGTRERAVREPSLSSTSRGPNMPRRPTSLALLLIALAVGTGGCDFLNPTNVINPTVTEDDFVQTTRAATVWTAGVERQMAIAMNQVVMGAEVASDNLFNNRTLFSKVFDIPLIEADDFDVTNIQAEIHRLRAMADDGLNKVIPADPTATDELRAQLHFHRAMAHLLAGELFVGLPVASLGPVEAPSVHLARAVADFQQVRALSTNAERRASALLGIARAQYGAGNRDAAVAAAAEVRATAPSLLRTVRFDITNGPTNTMQTAIYDSGQNEFQPLPRLDFLFPKYFSATAGDQKPIAILKGEEAFLILAEARIAQGDLPGARTVLGELIDLVATRPTALINDRGQRRGRGGGTWIYPNAADIVVQASPQDEPRAGLVLTRSGDPVRVPTVSGTSVSRAMLAAAATDLQLLELLYLMRQEIFVVEGRRMVDLGIRFPIARREAQANASVGADSPALQARIPAFIPGNLGMNACTYRDGDKLVVIHHNLNRVLVQNRASPMVLPFH
jgi:hypothetical protein